MAVVIALPLFGPPGRELEDGALTSPRLRTLATELHERLGRAADILDRLAADGWTARLGMYDAILAHPEVEATEQAARRLQGLGVAVEDLLIFEEAEDEEET